jgi:acetyltransferase-like isoleucine patch superfamily enzyme
MIKSIFKKIIHRFYVIGKFEDLAIRNIERKKYIDDNCKIGQNSCLFESAEVYNYQNINSNIVIGENTNVFGELCIYKHGGYLHIGDYCFVGPRTRIQSASKIVIGNNVLIAHDVNIHDNNSHPLDSKLRHEDFKRFLKFGFSSDINLSENEIIIEDDVWVGFGATILKGVKIGKGAIVGANCVVTRDVPAYAVVIGNPAVIKKYTT